MKRIQFISIFKTFLYQRLRVIEPY